MQPDVPEVIAVVRQGEYSERLTFLYKVVEDTQNTVRFLDTKAAFCVTLFSGMAAGALQHHTTDTPLHRALFATFLLAVVMGLLICMRVIFPVIKPLKCPTMDHGRPLPKFFIHSHKDHHWVRHTFSNSVENVLCEDHDSYTATIQGTQDHDLLVSMCDEVLMISLVRQIKSDRLHTAMYFLAFGVLIFGAVMLT
jgi:hypothetical protein